MPIHQLDLFKVFYIVISKLTKNPDLVMSRFIQSNYERKISLTLLQKFNELNARLENHKHSQLGQDVLAVLVNEYRPSNYFVEFGATNGEDLSNTKMLESEMGWKGILAEPAEIWWRQLEANRTAIIDHRCVWSHSGHWLDFIEAKELSGVMDLVNRRKGEEYVQMGRVVSVSLADLLRDHNAPRHIGLLSIDTEGSEYTIVKNFDFKKYSFNLIVIEHNYSRPRRLIKKTLKRNGYQRILSSLSKWDDWYIHEDIAKLIG